MLFFATLTIIFIQTILTYNPIERQKILEASLKNTETCSKEIRSFYQFDISKQTKYLWLKS